MRRLGFRQRAFCQSVVATVAVMGLVVALAPGSSAGANGNQANGPDPLAGSVAAPELLEELDAEDVARFVVEYTARPDLGPAYGIDDWAERGAFVTEALKATAATSQQEAIDLAAAAGAPTQSFWLRNVLVVEGDRALVEALAELDGVSSIRLERSYEVIEPVPGEQLLDIAAAEPAWGVAKIGAPAAWDRGITGAGVTVASIDTGVDYTHPALVNQYRGNQGDGTFDHNYNWWDPSGVCPTAAPCDNVEHGTHTMGTMVGGDGPGPFTPDVGVAYGAQWITAKGCEDFGCSESALLSSGEWVLAPTDLSGANPDPALRPDIVSNSWGGFPGDPFYLEVVQAWRAAGMIPVFASGNPGSACGFGGSPADYLESFSVGATDIDDAIYTFSGRGPSVYGKVNPEVTAPGVNVTSSVPGGGYAAFTGTSMATPHAAGTFALMLSAAPELVGQFDPAADVMRSTALDIIDMSCGGDADGDPNNVFGDGRIDAAAAVDVVTGGVLAGTVVDSATGAPIEGAEVSAVRDGGREFSATTAADGTYQLLLGAGSQTVTVTAFGYETVTTAGVEIVPDQTTAHDLALTPLPTFTVSGRVTYAENGGRVNGATVTALGTPLDPVVTDRLGRYTLTLPAGTYTIETTLGGCTNPGSAAVDLAANVTQNLEVTRKIDNFGHGCRPIRSAWVDAASQTGLFGDDVYGRLTLPFDFPYYGETYSTVFVSSNGFLSFVDPLQSSIGPDDIPSGGLPNAAIYPLWSDLVVDEAAHVDYGRRGGAFVVEFNDLLAFGGTERVDFEVKLWSDGRVHVLYRDNTGLLGSGSTATIGIESPAGDDALLFSNEAPSLSEGVAYSYQVVSTGVTSGVVTNLNDGEPVDGALVTAEPGGRTAVTGPDGSYSLRLVPGSYDLTATAENYAAATSPLEIAADEAPTVDFALPAARIEVSPTDISASTPAGVPTTETVTVTNTGTAPLDFEIRERDRSGTPASVPAASVEGTPFTRDATWGPEAVPEDWLANDAVGPLLDVPLESIIDDPDDDSLATVEITDVLAGSDGQTAIGMEIDFSPDTPMIEVGGYVFLDTDQDPTTGFDPADLFGLPTQDIGVDYVADIFSISFGDVFIYDQFLNLVAIVPGEIVGQSAVFDVPLDILGVDDGFVDTAMIVGDFFQPTDWAPDVGHGTIEPFVDAPWMSAEPLTGTLAPGESVEVIVTLGGAGIAAGDYTGELVVLANDPRQATLVVDVTLEVL